MVGLIAAAITAQDAVYAREIIEKLCSESMHGRGYVRKGDKKAARYIASEYGQLNLLPMGRQYYQYLPLDVNTFPAAMSVTLNGRPLKAGYDYMIEPSSPGVKGTFTAKQVTGEQWLKGTGIIDGQDKGDQPTNLAVAVEITTKKLLFGVSNVVGKVPKININAAACPDSIINLQLNIENHFVGHYESQNVVGYIRGTACPDSFIVFTAHYDHLGMMGKKTWFPGANDNASGVAMLLNLAAYFTAHPPRYSIAFIAFTGEEAGLLGSSYFVENPLMNLSAIKFLINLDLVGNGPEGIMVVNGSVFARQLELLNTINKEQQFVSQIKTRGEACNSDHCVFYRQGVPCFFIYTLGGPANYHNPADAPQNLTLTAFEGLTRLLIHFSEKL